MLCCFSFKHGLGVGLITKRKGALPCDSLDTRSFGSLRNTHHDLDSELFGRFHCYESSCLYASLPIYLCAVHLHPGSLEGGLSGCCSSFSFEKLESQGRFLLERELRILVFLFELD